MQVAQEDPLIQIERCKSDAKQQADKSVIRWKIGLSIPAINDCMSNPNCNLSNTLEFLESMQEKQKATWYESHYSSCISKTKGEFYKEIQILDSYWEACQAHYAKYNDQLPCVTNLINSRGL